MRTSILLIASALCFMFSGCAACHNNYVAAEKTQADLSYGLYLEPLDPVRNMETLAAYKDSATKQTDLYIAAAAY